MRDSIGFLAADWRCRDRRLLRFGQRYGFFRGCELGLEQPVAVVLQISVEGCEAALGDDEELVGGGAQQVPVVRDEHERAFELREGDGERLAQFRSEEARLHYRQTVKSY